MTTPTKFLALLFTDLVGSTELKRVHGDKLGSAAITRHDELFRACLDEHGGVEQNNPGDGFFATFDVPSSAVLCALAFQRGLRDLGLEARVGIHAGEASLVPGAHGQQAKLLGLAVDIAGRVESLAGAGQILLTRHVFDSARQHVLEDAVLAWRAHGPYLLKGVDEPIEIFETGDVGAAPLTAPGDSEKARRAVRPGDEETLGWRPAAGLDIPGRGDWRLEEKLGEGGFGEIWLARNAQTKEAHAFKFCFHADRVRNLKRELALFRLIKQTLGDRPDITRLHEVRFDEAPYFLEMEYTSGGSLDHWFVADAVPLATRLELAAQVADALAAAHSVGVIHKDIKPSNVLIDTTRADRPQARLTDFGIGTLLDRSALGEVDVTGGGFEGQTLVTDLNSRTGTRLYMAPELLAGRPASIASDLYSTGVLLYQLAVGDLGRPLAQGWEADVGDELLREDIAACVAGSPEARLSSADLLATRLRTREARQQERKAARENERRQRFLRVSLVTSLVALLVAGLAAAAYFHSEKQRRRAEAAEERASKRFEEVRELANAVLFEFDGKLLDLPGSLPARRLLVERALKYLDNLPADDADLALERARGYAKVGGIQGAPGLPNLGDREGALASFGKAVEHAERAHRLAPTSIAAQTALAQALRERGALRTFVDRDPNANPDIDRAVALLQDLADKKPDATRVQVLLAETLSAQAIWHYLSDRNDESEKTYARSIGMLKKLHEAGQLGRNGLRGLAVAHSNVARSFSSVSSGIDPKRALEHLARERSILEELETPGRVDLRLEQARVRNAMVTAKAHYFGKEAHEAASWYGKASDLATRLLSLHPNDLRTRRLLATVCRGQAQLYRRQPEKKVAHYRRGIAALTNLPPGSTLPSELLQERAVLHEWTARALIDLEKRSEASKHLGQAVADFETNFDPTSPDPLRYSMLPAACARAAAMLADPIGDIEGAIALYRRTLVELQRVKQQPDDDFVEHLGARASRELADLLVKRGDRKEAAALYRQVLALFDRYPEIAKDREAVEQALAALEAR